MEKICDGVFEGGGIRGIGIAGAVAAIEDADYRFSRVAGTSAGAIVASLVAAGYTAAELRTEIDKLDFKQFKDAGIAGEFGPLGMLYALNKSFGFYDTDYFERWLEEVLLRKNVKKFSDLKIPLKITATDVTDNKLLILPDDIENFGIKPEDLSVALAVRMSISIPIFFKPYRLTDTKGRIHFIVDGGVMSNYPIWLFDDGISGLRYPVFGFKFINERFYSESAAKKKIGLVQFIKDVGACVLDAQDTEYFYYSNNDQSVKINTVVDLDGKEKQIGSTHFDITKQESDALYKNGYVAGKQFIENFDFNEYCRRRG